MTQNTEDTVSRWERRKEQTHQRLLAAAEQLFRAQGFDATTVEEIAVAADVGKGTFFNYFSSKEALLGELLHTRLRLVMTTRSNPALPVTERIWEVLLAVRKELRPYTHLFQRMFSYVLAHPSLDSLPADNLTLAHVLADVVHEGQVGGVFRSDVDPEIVGAMIATFFFRLCVFESVSTRSGKCSEEQAYPWEEDMRSGLDLVYRGLCSEGTC